jgi:cytochrome c oxidase assembly protein subunit 15
MITTLFLQILSGGYVVLSKLSVEALMVHGAIISLFFGALCFLCWRALQKPTQKHLIEETVNDTI